MNDSEIQEKFNDFNIRREKIAVKIQAQKLKRARLDLHYAQFVAELARARDLENAQFEANLDALDRAQALEDQLPQPTEKANTQYVHYPSMEIRNRDTATDQPNEETK